jgi:hypothetical protein
LLPVFEVEVLFDSFIIGNEDEDDADVDVTTIGSPISKSRSRRVFEFTNTLPLRLSFKEVVTANFFILERCRFES